MTRLLLAFPGGYLATRATYRDGNVERFEVWRYQQPGGWRRLDERETKRLDVVLDQHGYTARVAQGSHLSTWTVLRGWRAHDVYRKIGDPFAEPEPYTATDAHLDEVAAVDRADRAERRREFSGVDNDRGEP
jgi:hypothetical protein